MSAEFVDTNIVLYLLDDGPKADRAEAILGQGPRISVQVLNEAMVNCRRKAGRSWDVRRTRSWRVSERCVRSRI